VDWRPEASFIYNDHNTSRREPFVKSPLTPEGKLKFNHGKPVEVEYACPACGMQLKSKVEEIGEDFPCPTCGTLLTVPGHAEMHAWEAKEEEKRRQKASSAWQRAEEQARAVQQQQQASEHQRQHAKEAAAKAREVEHANTATWIIAASRIIDFLGVIYVGIGILAILGGLYAISQSSAKDAGAPYSGGMLLASGLASLALGVIVVGFGAALRMVAYMGRDIRAMRDAQVHSPERLQA
jgi:uncharacterized Zn finger protein (UPF0148 family)